MDIIGIVVEYNPFHNGHLHHLNTIKNMYPNSIVIAVMSGNFNERGEVSIIPKWDKAKIALECGIDIVVELPYAFASQAADIFSYGAISIMKHMNVDTIVFGSESNNVESLKTMASVQINNPNYDNLVKEYMNSGLNYPTSMSSALFDLTNIEISSPNDILGICYIKEILKQNCNINPVCIQRTNNYHDISLGDTISSATSIRRALKEGIDVSKYVPDETMKYLNGNLYFNDQYFKLLKYKILTDNNLDYYHTVDEGIDYKLKEVIINSISYDDLVNKIKTKRYTYNRISRMLVHILNSFTKEEALLCNTTNYIRVLGFNNTGQKYLNSIKKEVVIPIITNFSSHKDLMLDIEMRSSSVYYSVLNEKIACEMMKEEYKHHPIKK